MPVLAEYRPTQTPGANVQAFMDARDQTASLMERKQRLAMAQEQQQMARQEFIAKMPAIVAKRDADLVTAAASIANATRMEQLRKQAAESSTDYNDRFLNIMSIADSKERSDTLGAFMGEVAWLDNPALPEYQGFAKAVREERAKSFTEAATNQKLDEALERNRLLVEGRNNVAETNATARQSNAQTYTASRERIAQINADTRLSVEEKRAARQAITVETMQQRAMEADQLAADAARDGDEQLAETFRQNAAAMRDAIQKTTTFAGTAPSAPRTAAQDPRPTPRETVPAPPALTINGKSLAKKLYVVDETTKTPSFAPDVQTPNDIAAAVQQMVDDAVIDAAAARAMLLRLGFRPKK